MEEIYYLDIECIERGSEKYPRRLRQLRGMPKKLYVRGELPRDDRPTIAIVGARACSAYGRRQAFLYAQEMSRAGVQVISGLAAGIDGRAHSGALEGGTPTFAVLGSGVDICYPKQHDSLYRQVWQSGGLISEKKPGTMPLGCYFPARNRIISGLADVVLVIEAREKSGSLITVDFAMEQGKSVYALPGPVDSSLSRGCHQLLEQGAGVAGFTQKILEEWGIQRETREDSAKKNSVRLARDLNLVYSGLDLQPKNLHEIVEYTHFSVTKTINCLTELELEGLVERIGHNFFVKKTIL